MSKGLKHPSVQPFLFLICIFSVYLPVNLSPCIYYCQSHKKAVILHFIPLQMYKLSRITSTLPILQLIYLQGWPSRVTALPSPEETISRGIDCKMSLYWSPKGKITHYGMFFLFQHHAWIDHFEVEYFVFMFFCFFFLKQEKTRLLH